MNNLYTEEELQELKRIVGEITTHIPQDKSGYIWSNFQKVMNTREKQPCSCGSSAKHWKRAIDTLREYIKE